MGHGGLKFLTRKTPRAYGRWLGGRMKDKENILWILAATGPWRRGRI